ncbi:MAG: hypothetical protein IJ024_03350 [Lachnospiraceae bacterium]|nr:hypothetical protein [Lachnospiraceae bacterium]
MMKKMMKKWMFAMLAALIFCTCSATVNATQQEETTEDTVSDNPLGFEIAIFSYEIVEEATQDDMPPGFTLGEWEFNGVAVKAGFTENSDMVCVMGKDLENGNQYRFIYDPNHDMFVPYFGAEIKNGYIYTVPMYEDAEVPYGFVESYFVIQTVPMFTYMREDAELTQEEIAVGSLSEDNYLVFLMMDETGKEVHYTYDLIDRTFQRALLQKKDAEKVTELNETIDKLSEDIGKLNAANAERMNKRLTIIGVLIAAIIIMAGVIVNLLLKISKLKNGADSSEMMEADDEDESDEEIKGKGLLGFFLKKKDSEEEDEDEEYDDYEEDSEESYEEPVVVKKATPTVKTELDDDDDLEILDLDLEDF